MTLAEFQALLAGTETALDLPLWDESPSCPCFTFEVPGFKAVGHCWRTWYRNESGRHCSHVYVGLHYWGDVPTAKRLRELLNAMEWYGKWPMRCEGAAP